jgi:hypothetical protein
MLFDHIYHNRKLMMTIPTGVKLQELIALYDTKKQKVLNVSRFLKKDSTSIWHIKTVKREVGFCSKILNYLKTKLLFFTKRKRW